MTDQIDIRQMTRPEVDDLVDWAAQEGWNPGLHDADIFWKTDPDAFIAAELNGEVVGGGAITSYAGKFGFMGFFILRPAFRGRGFGNALWHARRERLLARLDPGASIGMDGVFDMQPYYAKGGFAFSHRDIRYRVENSSRSTIQSPKDDTIIDLAEAPFDDVLTYDRTCFPASRPAFLQAWIRQPDGRALGIQRDGSLCGFGVIRRCREGYKIGPLFADGVQDAMALFGALLTLEEDGPVFVDIPENNPAAIHLVNRYNMNKVFGCARMYLGPVPDIFDERIFGVTTFELG